MSNGLGRGLGSLIPQKNNKIKNSDSSEIVFNVNSKDDKDRVLKINPEKINVNPMQPRKNFSEINMEELIGSIQQHGIIQPLIVSQKNGQYELIAGERRLRASKSLGLKEVPAILRDVKEQEKLEVSLIENLQRKDLNPVETAMAYQKLINEFNLNQEEMAKRVGKSRSSVANTLRLLNLPQEIQLALIEDRITEGHAKYLIGLDSEDKQMALFKKIMRNKLTVADTGFEARRMGGTKQSKIKINYQDKDKEFAFREFFNTRVEIKRSRKGGQIIIDFFSDEELLEMAEKIK
ncbi:MAG: ParB/RepB/Spo0J family partition protein [Patescibacteria group bacterium]